MSDVFYVSSDKRYIKRILMECTENSKMLRERTKLFATRVNRESERKFNLKLAFEFFV